MVVKKPCCMSDKCIDLAIEETRPLMMARCSGDVARDWLQMKGLA
jgi:hypothetical protein